MMNRKGPWEGYRRQAKQAGLARCLLPAFLCAHIFIGRETSGYEAGVGRYENFVLNRKASIFGSYVIKEFAHAFSCAYIEL